MEEKMHLAHNEVIKNIAFFGDSEFPESDQTYKDAYDIAKMLAEKGYTIVNGGGPGVMNAATQGAESVGGETLAVTFYPENAPGFEGKYLRNVTDKEIKTHNYIERMFKLMEHGDLYIIFRGGSGTMSEFATAWVLAKLYYGHHKPFILYGSFWREIVESVKKGMSINETELDVFKIIDKEEEVLPTIEHFQHELMKVNHDGDCQVCAEKAFMM
jgi:hypothetical protein